MSQTPFSIILASQSPRRHELLSQMLRDSYSSSTVVILPVHLDESVQPSEIPLHYVKRMACEKFIAALTLIKQNKILPASTNCILLTADTIVTFNNTILGKPKDEEDAKSMLTQLSGRTHDVITAYCLQAIRPETPAAVPSEAIAITTKVTFKSLSDLEIQNYCQTSEPYDKAGGYGIQGLAGAFVTSIQGSFHNVVGLPTESVEQALSEILNSPHF